MEQLMVVIDGRDISSAQLDDIALGLRRELLELPVHDVVEVRNGTVPEGARGIDPAMVGAFVVLLNSSVALLASVVTTLRSWRRNTIPGGSIRLKLGDDELELTGLSDEVEAKLVEEWTRRHGS
jgi:hypothetical protein